MTPDEALARIHIARVLNYKDLADAIRAVPQFHREHPNVSLLIIDSISFLLRHAFSSHKELCAALEALLTTLNDVRGT